MIVIRDRKDFTMCNVLNDLPFIVKVNIHCRMFSLWAGVYLTLRLGSTKIHYSSTHFDGSGRPKALLPHRPKFSKTANPSGSP